MQRHSVKLILNKQKINTLGQVPVYLRITVNRKTNYISTGYWIVPKHWDEPMELVKESHPTHQEINLDITNKKKEILRELIDAGMKGKPVTSKSLKRGSQKKLTDIYTFAEQHAKTIKGNRSQGTLDNYIKHLNKLREFVGGEISFQEIDTDFLERFVEYLRNGGVKKSDANPNNYIDAILRTIRTLFNVARKKGVAENYPFSQFEMPKIGPGNKSYLTLQEVIKWHGFAMKCQHPYIAQAAVYFLFGCYTGLRLSDWRDFDDVKIKNNNISVEAIKNKAWVAVPFHKGHKELFVRMKEVPLTIVEPTINRHLKTIAKHLKIEKKITTHCARKTFAVTMCLERGVSAETAAKLMGITLAVFEKNYSFITKEKIRMETSKAWKGLFNDYKGTRGTKSI